MLPESESDTLTAESIAMQVIQNNPESAKKYASGDLTMLGLLQEKAVKLAAGRISEHSVKETLLRKLSASI